MNVSLTPELENLVNSKVNSGMYHSASEVIRAGLRLLQEQDELRALRLEGLRREIAKGVEQADRGELLEGQEVLAGLDRRIDEIAAAAKGK
jgi:antitoxin ParD1/3/4